MHKIKMIDCPVCGELTGINSDNFPFNKLANIIEGLSHNKIKVNLRLVCTETEEKEN